MAADISCENTHPETFSTLEENEKVYAASSASDTDFHRSVPSPDAREFEMFVSFGSDLLQTEGRRHKRSFGTLHIAAATQDADPRE